MDLITRFVLDHADAAQAPSTRALRLAVDIVDTMLHRGASPSALVSAVLPHCT